MSLHWCIWAESSGAVPQPFCASASLWESVWHQLVHLVEEACPSAGLLCRGLSRPTEEWHHFAHGKPRGLGEGKKSIGRHLGTHGHLTGHCCHLHVLPMPGGLWKAFHKYKEPFWFENKERGGGKYMTLHIHTHILKSATEYVVNPFKESALSFWTVGLARP